VQEGGSVKTGRREDEPQQVPQQAKLGGEGQSRWGWVEPSVWTPRMLNALETGLKGGKWHSLIDKVYRAETLEAAWKRVRANRGSAGVDHQTIRGFERIREHELARLADELRNGTYRPRPIRRVEIPKPGRPGEVRPLGIPAVRDRVVQAALQSVIEPIFEAQFAEHSYGFRPGRKAKDALRRVNSLIQDGHSHIVDADLKGYFDTIPHEGLKRRVAELIADGRVLALIDAYLGQDVMKELERWTPTAGTPQGAVVSPLLANLYLDPLDHIMAGLGYEMVRYADDFVILCRSEQAAKSALAIVQSWAGNAGLTLHPEKTRIVDLETGESFDFLGYRFTKSGHDVRPKSLKKVKDRIRELTPRNSGVSLETTIKRLNRVLAGWYQYFKQARKTTMGKLDSFIRRRLRGILWRNSKRHGRVSQHANHIWPNAHFGERGLFSLSEARVREVQSAAR
jgi:RNA-directed DNA polymerase